MTMTEIRKKFKELKGISKHNPNPEMAAMMVEYWNDFQNIIEEIWSNGFSTNYSEEFLKVANGFQINTGNYTTCHISDTYDLHCIKMDKVTVKEFAAYFLR